jgi:hypothetical protein
MRRGRNAHPRDVAPPRERAQAGATNGAYWQVRLMSTCQSGLFVRLAIGQLVNLTVNARVVTCTLV